MKLLITTLTMIFISFGANAKINYNTKFSDMDCKYLYIDAKSLFKSYEDAPDPQALIDYRKWLAELSVIYQAFCKD